MNRVVFVAIFTAILSIFQVMIQIASASPEFMLTQEIGGEASNVYLPNPRFAVQTPDGTTMVFCELDCQFVMLSEDWEVEGGFGRCGEGPGDLSGADAVFVVRDSLMVTQGFSYSIFDFHGNFVRSADFTRPIAKPLKLGNCLVGVDYFGMNKILSLDLASLDQTVLFEPKRKDFFVPLMVYSGAAFFYGQLSGNIYEVHPKMPVQVYDLGLTEQEVSVSESKTGQIQEWVSVISSAWGDGSGGAYICVNGESAPYLDGGTPVFPNMFRHYKPGFTDFDLVHVAPTDIPMVLVTPLNEGRLAALDQFGSRLFLLEGNP